jgi:4-hydroxymandelate oxidase
MNQPVNLFEYEKLALQKLANMTYDYYASGADDQITLKENRNCFQKYRLRPKMLIDVSKRDLTTTILGQTLSMPILIAPMAFQCLANPEGEVATAKAASKFDTVMILSTMSTKSIEEVAEVNSKRWFQLYIHKDRGLTEALVQRAENAGYTALCVTVDAPLMGKRESDVRNQFTLPLGMELANLKTMNDLKIPEVTKESGLFAYFQQQIDASLTWKDVEWLQSITNLPILLKGILRGDDAVIASKLGINGIIVSNHGGRQLDTAIASINALPEIAEAVGDKLEVLVDGGVRRGTDVLKALSLGAKAVLVGRPILWGLAINGQEGVNQVLQLLRHELDLAMALSGCPSLKEINSSLIVMA